MKLRAASGAALVMALVGGLTSMVSAQDTARGAALLAQAQQAVGGRAPLDAAKTLHVTGTFRRVLANNDTEGDFEVFLELPDKYLRSEKTGTPGQPSTERIEALVGTQVRNEVRGGGGRGGAARITGGEAPPDGGVTPPEAADAPPPLPDDDLPIVGGFRGLGARGRGAMADPEAQRRTRQADVSRLMLMWLLRSDVPVAWVGIAESPDGKADVLEARFADNVPTRLFLDVETHMPLMMTWQGMPVGAGARRGGMPQRGRIQAMPVLPPPEPVNFEMTFSEHRAVDGIRLPHAVTRGMNGETTERWTIRRYRVNPTLEADTFTR
jgi:hypothetical protein